LGENLGLGVLFRIGGKLIRGHNLGYRFEKPFSLVPEKERGVF